MKNIHSGPKECPHCGKILKSEKSLQGHMASLHSGKEKSKCSQCGKSYAAKYKLFLHIKREHEGLQPYNCKICNKGFINRSEAAIHIGTKHEMWTFEHAKKNYNNIIESKHPALIKNKLTVSSDEEG